MFKILIIISIIIVLIIVLLVWFLTRSDKKITTVSEYKKAFDFTEEADVADNHDELIGKDQFLIKLKDEHYAHLTFSDGSVLIMNNGTMSGNVRNSINTVHDKHKVQPLLDGNYAIFKFSDRVIDMSSERIVFDKGTTLKSIALDGAKKMYYR